MEASALHAPKVGRRAARGPLLRLRTDEQLVALFRDGSEEAFTVLHDRYRQRLFGYVRQMLTGASRADAEDVLQDVFVRAYGALRADSREVNARAWLYRVAHNRCVDHLRRPVPAASDVYDVQRGPALQDPMEAAQRREDLRRLVADVGELPEQQRSALLMREIDGLAYVDIAAALDVTVPAVKSLLVRARGGLVDSMLARDTDCEVIRADLLEAYERGVKAPARARRHLRECKGCREYKAALRSMRKSFAALSPALGFGPLALAAKALGIGGAGAGGAGAAGAGLTTAGACKVAAVVCAGALATGGAMEAKHLVQAAGDPPQRERAERPGPERTAKAAAAAVPAAAVAERATIKQAPAAAAPTTTRAERRAERRQAAERRAQRELKDGISAPMAAAPVTAPAAPAPVATPAPDPVVERSGGASAPADAAPVVKQPAGSSQPTTASPPVPTATPAPAAPTAPTTTPPAATPAPTPAGPPTEH